MSTGPFLEERLSEPHRLGRVRLLAEKESSRELGEHRSGRDDLFDLLDLLGKRVGAPVVERAHSSETTRGCGIKGDAPEEKDSQPGAP